MQSSSPLKWLEIVPVSRATTSAITTLGASWSRTLYRTPGVAFALQFPGIHGRKGLRKRLSALERTDERKTQASGHSLKIETDKEGRRAIHPDLPTDPRF